MTARSDDLVVMLREFKVAVNMTPAALEKWLATGESRAVGIVHGEGTESVGHHSGRRIVELLNKADVDLDENDLAHMRKVVGYVHRHLAQRPGGDVRHTHWRWSLMNWGHDPLTE
jgi:hypothetical protein